MSVITTEQIELGAHKYIGNDGDAIYVGPTEDGEYLVQRITTHASVEWEDTYLSAESVMSEAVVTWGAEGWQDGFPQ